ncbi:MAG: hypothetical protein GX638_08275 [Crenarchaeota archaeon]|nr:hypothetical protein [Thermoproteota archaeon]
MSQETAAKPIAETSSQIEKKPVSVQDIVESLRNIQDDIGQISELTSEEHLLAAQFFKSFMTLMEPLTTAIPVAPSSLPPEYGHCTNAYVNPRGQLAILFRDGRMDIKNLEEEKNRELMIATIEDIMPKFKSLTTGQKRKLENRIKFLTTITKELQKISDAVIAVNKSLKEAK